MQDSIEKTFIEEIQEHYDKRESLSIKDKLVLVYEMSCHIGYSDGRMIVRPSDEYEDISDDVWMFIDGLYQRWFDKMINCQCSLKTMAEFDMEAEEKIIDNYIDSFYLKYKEFNV